MKTYLKKLTALLTLLLALSLAACAITTGRTSSSCRIRVKYTNSWEDFHLEKQCAKQLIDEGCVIISQHSDTRGLSQAPSCRNAAQ